jgi:Flp pilus assembly pilin Flp
VIDRNPNSGDAEQTRGCRFRDGSRYEPKKRRLSTLLAKTHIWLLTPREEGQTMAEYAVVLGVITLAVVGVFTALSGGISNALNAVTSAI